MPARFDKHGRRLPDTGHGCGCKLCADSNAPRHERRSDGRPAGLWSPLRRRLILWLRAVGVPRRQAA